METSEKQKAIDRTEAEKEIFQDEAFDFSEPENQEKVPAGFWLQWSLLFVIGFYFLSILVDGFADMHRYGIQETTGLNYIFLITKSEKIFYAGLLFLLPAAIFFALFLESTLKFDFVAKLTALEKPANAKRTVAVLVLMAGALALITTLGILKQSPTSDDENVYLFQTRIMAQGQLTLDGKPENDALFEDNIFLVNNGKIYGQYPFGHSAILLAGYLVKFPYLTQILAAMLTVLGMFLLGRELYGIRTGLIGAGLIAFSPMLLFTAGTLLSHVNAIFFLTWFGYFAVKTVRDDKLLYALLCGLAFGGAFHIRGATTMLVGMPAALTLAFFMLKSPVKNLKKIVALGVTVGLSVGFMLYLNWAVNGDITHTNYHAAWIGKTQFDSPFGFGKGAWRIIHTPAQGFLNLVNNFVRLNAWTFGWPIGFLFVIVWAIRKGKKWVDALLALPIVLTFTGYFFYFWPGISDTGPVLYFELLLPITLLTACGIQKTPALLSRWMSSEKATSRTVLFIATSVLFALMTFHFYNARALAKLPDIIAEPYQHVAVPEGEKAVVFSDYYFKETGQGSWIAGRKNTHPALGDKVIYVLDYGKKKNEAFLKKYYPDYKGYVFHFKYGIPKFMPLNEYDVQNYLKNYPDSR